jgi:nitroreductase
MTNPQEFGSPITDIIRKRISVRTYQNRSLNHELKIKLRDFASSLKGPFGGDLRLEIVENNLALKESKVQLGTYGVIKGASTYAVPVIKRSNKDLEDFGYIIETFILFATSLGLGTCWLGGTFKKSDFAKAVALKEDEILPCITPLGYPSSRRSVLESAMRITAGSKNRKPWEDLFFKGNFKTTLEVSEAGNYQTPLEMVRLAPSASNKQPWRIVKNMDNYHFYLQHTKGYAKLLAHDLQRVDMGIALCHFERTAKEMGIAGKWSINPPEGIPIPPNTEYVVSWEECG